MIDTVDTATRSRIMAKVHSRDTSPEKALRKELFRMGFRYRVNCSTLPGTPDMVFSKYRSVIFVHGCFWHWHGCRSHLPKTNAVFWREKIIRNKNRDLTVIDQLIKMGWRVLVVWECALKFKFLAESAQLTADWLRCERKFSVIELINKDGAKKLSTHPGTIRKRPLKKL